MLFIKRLYPAMLTTETVVSSIKREKVNESALTKNTNNVLFSILFGYSVNNTNFNTNGYDYIKLTTPLVLHSSFEICETRKSRPKILLTIYIYIIKLFFH